MKPLEILQGVPVYAHYQSYNLCKTPPNKQKQPMSGNEPVGAQVEIRGQANSEEISHQRRIIFRVINPRRTKLHSSSYHRAFFMLDGLVLFIGMNSGEKYKGF